MAGSILPPESGGSLGSPASPWTDAVLSGSVTDADGNASTAEQIKTARTQAAASIPSSEKGAASGVAPLGADSIVPLINLPATMPPSAHNQALSTITDAGNSASRDVGTTAGTVAAGDDARLSDTRTPKAHAASHASGAADAIKLDDLASPDDNTDLNATINAHGLLKKLSGTATEYMNGSGNWTTPAGGASLWTDIASVTRTDSNTFAKAGLETVMVLGSHVRSYSGTTRPATTSTDWKHHYVSAVGTDAVDVCGEEIPTGGATLFVEISSNIVSTMKMIDVQVPGYWAYAIGTSRLASQVFSARPCIWNEPASRLIGAISVKSVSDDTGANQPTLMITCGGTDLLGGALTVSETVANTGVIASGQALSNAEIIDIDCEATGSNKDSKDLIATFLIARHI